MIIDASVAFKWIVPEDDSHAAERLLSSDLHAPRLILAEVGNAIWARVRRGELSWAATLADDLGRLSGLVTLQDEADCVARALEIAHEVEHPIYDCIYLALAEQLDEQLVTADRRFLNKLAGHPSAGRVRMLTP